MIRTTYGQKNPHILDVATNRLFVTGQMLRISFLSFKKNSTLLLLSISRKNMLMEL